MQTRFLSHPPKSGGGREDDLAAERHLQALLDRVKGKRAFDLIKRTLARRADLDDRWARSSP
ncbi:MAG: hypothetical protein GY719_12860 [bacterium]|nr:hypothetical protein [bacterium]